MMNENTIIRRARGKENPYFLMSRDVAQNRTLSYEAVGLAAYLLSRPDDWQIIVGDLLRDGSAGRDKVYRVLNELIASGHLTRLKQPHSDGGKFAGSEYIFHELPCTEEPCTEKPYTALPYTANPLLHSRESTEERKDSAPKEGAVDPHAKRERKPDPLFDAVKELVFRIDGNAEGGRIAQISTWLAGKNDGKREKVGMITSPAEREHVEQFVAWCEQQRFTPPLSLVKFVENWRKWVSATNGNHSSSPLSGLQIVVDKDDE